MAVPVVLRGGHMSTLYRARVVRIDGTGVYVEIPELGEGGEWGPLELLSFVTNEGDPVVVGSINDIMEDLALLGPLVTEPPEPFVMPPIPPFPPTNSRYVLYYENEAARTAAALTPVSGMTTWLDDEQRLDVYTDEGLGGWIAYYGFKLNILALPSAARINIGGDTELYRNAAGNWHITDYVGIGVDGDGASRLKLFNPLANGRGLTSVFTAAAQTGSHVYLSSAAGQDAAPAIRTMLTGEAQERFTVRMNGLLEWGDGTTPADVNLNRSGTGNLTTNASFFAASMRSYSNITADGGLEGAYAGITTDAYVGSRLLLGPLQRDIGRGLHSSYTSGSASASIGTTEAVVGTIASTAYKAGRAYRVVVEGNLLHSAATSVPALKLRKTNLAGAIVVDLGRQPVGAAAVIHTAYASRVFTVGVSDVTTALAFTTQSVGGSTTATWQANHAVQIYDIGPATDYPNKEVLS